MCDIIKPFPRAVLVDNVSFLKAVGGFSEGVVVGACCLVSVFQSGHTFF